MALPSARFPHASVLEVGGCAYPADLVRDALAPFLSERRCRRIAEVVEGRTYTVVPVLEALSDAGNLHAVLRSAEGLGYGAAHVVAPEGEVGPVVAAYATGLELAEDALGQRAGVRAAQGAHKWVDLKAWSDAEAFVASAHSQGYAVVATHLSADAVPITAWDFTQPTALVFGNERDGVSAALLAHADANMLLPIDGFIQSYNISVAAALALYHARQDRLTRQGHHGDLTPDEQAILTAQFYIRSVAAASQILAREVSG